MLTVCEATTVIPFRRYSAEVEDLINWRASKGDPPCRFVFRQRETLPPAGGAGLADPLSASDPRSVPPNQHTCAATELADDQLLAPSHRFAEESIAIGDYERTTADCAVATGPTSRGVAR
jgi:hypothetical protein